MVDAIVDIPLPGQMPIGQKDEQKSSFKTTAHHHFLAGPENHLVQVAVRHVIDEKPNGYNPIVFYGPSGTGKSHLALGIAAAWKAKKRRRVECVSAVDFARELADAIETQAIEEFRAKYRKVDLLVFEDICRLINRKSEKLSAQEEFVCTLDALVNRDAWIVVTSMSAPGEMTGIMPTLQSRLTAGLIVPLAPPEPDTRLMILRQLAKTRRIDLPEPAAKTLADGFHGTVPELMGALIQLEVPARRDGASIDILAVRNLLNKRNSKQGPNLNSIALASAKHFGLKIAELRGPSRQQSVVTARNAAIFLARNLLHDSFDQIGQYFGGRDHTTVMHSWNKIDSLMKTDPVTRREVEEIEQDIFSKNGSRLS